MSAKRFKFVSPGVFVNEIDNSQLPQTQERLGPVIIGRTERGPSMRPVTVSSQAEFIEMFGSTIPGGKSGDVWREGNYQSPTYASYAAMAYLRNNGPVTMVRLLGHEHPQAEAAGAAGWKVGESAGNAFGLFLYPSASGVAHDANKNVTGTLAAIFYCDEGAVGLKGANHSTGAGTEATGTGVGVESVGSNNEFKAVVYETDGDNSEAITETINFNFNRDSDKFIRKVFNTNPSLVNKDGTITEGRRKTYFLGQTFEDAVNDYITDDSSSKVIGIMLQLDAGANKAVGVQQNPATAGTTGWVFSQQLTNDTGSFAPKTGGGVDLLFKLSALDCGEWESKNLKVSIEDIRYSKNVTDNPYGSFTVSVRKARDNDGSLQPVERFANCNLNPQSANYVKRKIGDQTLEWDEQERRYKVVGDYPNMSQFIRIEVNNELDNGALDPLLLPFGFQGPSRLIPVISGHTTQQPTAAKINTASGGTTIVTIADSNGRVHASEFNIGRQVTLEFPQMRLRESTLSGSLSSARAAYWGIDTLQSGSDRTHYEGYCDLVYPMVPSASESEMQFAFSLDDVMEDSGGGSFSWAEGNRNQADGNSKSLSGVSGSWKEPLDQGMDKFTMPLHGGFDGVDIRTLDPFAPNMQIGADASDKSSYEYYSIRKAIDTCSDPEVVECNMMAVPGITNNSINQHLINVCENRADALAVIDLDGGYLPRHDRAATNTSFASYGGSVTGTLSNLNLMRINSSYACSYYPWVQVRDQLADSILWVPPSVVAIGTMGSSEAKSEVWFAPAGFTRGGLSEGSAGMPVLGVRDRLTAKQRDDLYQQNVNPIASFPAEGIVIFGQKTMQVTPSALDRINVRRLMIFVKKEISRMAATTLFDQNVQSTWNRFLGRVNPFLRSVQARLGLTEFKVVLDETTTTPELVDRNIMYAKILLKPARAIEYIAIDFVITNSGASFED